MSPSHSSVNRGALLPEISETIAVSVAHKPSPRHDARSRGVLLARIEGGGT